MKRVFIATFLIANLFSCFAQKALPSFGKPDLQELTMKECSFEKEAGAMKLIDQQETEITVGNDLKIEVNRRVRIKIFKQNGFEAANITIPYIRRNKTSKVNDITAYIYNLDSSGNIITQKIEKKQIYREKSEDGFSKVAFTFPNVKPGSVIEYRYTHTEKNSLHLEPWFFQDVLPTAISTSRFIYPKEVKIDFRFITSDSVIHDFNDKLTRLNQTFTLNNIPSFRPEPMMSSVKDNLQRVEFAFVPKLGMLDFIINDNNRWKLFNLSLLMSPFFGMQIFAPIPGTEKILDSVKFFSTPSEKIHFIYQQVKEHLKWDDRQSFYADDLGEIWKIKSGNSAEINLTILNLLKKSNITCYPILISTRSNGRPDPGFMSLGQFNGVDVLIIDSADFYVLDGTQKYLSYKTTPYNILNRDVFIIDKEKSKWVNIVNPKPLMKTVLSVKAELNNMGELRGDGFISYYDHSKAFHLEEKSETPKEKEDEDKEFIQKESGEFIMDSLVEENATNELLPLNHTFRFTYKLSNTDDYYFLDPFFLSNFRKNPFNDSLRRTDIDMGSNQSFSMSLHLTIPEDYMIDELPKSLLIRAEDSSMMFKRVIQQQDNIILFRNSFEIQRAIYSKEEYPGIRDYFRKIYGMVSEQIVLKKKK